MQDALSVPNLLQELEQACVHAGFTGHDLARIEGLQSRAYRKHQSPKLPTIYLSAGIHGDEPAGPFALLELLRSGQLDERANWLLCPLLNPGGMQRQTRENPDGIDLNRDYLKRSSLEVSRHVEWLKNQGSIDLAISLHEDYESSGFYLYEINCIECHSDAKAILKAVSPVFPPESQRIIDDHEVRDLGWIFHQPEADFPGHWPEAIWLAKNDAAVSYTFETPSSSPLSQRIEAQRLATLELLTNFTDRHSPA